MTKPNVLRVAIMSDIHADRKENADTYVCEEPATPRPGFHPLSDLMSYLGQPSSTLRADVLLCPGDIANKSSTSSKQYAWNKLNEVGHQLQVDHVFASPGNHDVETRTPGVDPTADLRNLAPSYPTRIPILDKHFWEHGYSVYEDAVYRVVNVNTCAGFPAHPGSGATDDELEAYYQKLNRGSFPETTELKLREELQKMSHRSVNILLCHHHPLEHQLLARFQDGYGPMSRGGDLIKLLDENADAGRWIIIHGHKHVPQLTASGYSANAPVVLCAASVGGKLWHPVVTVTRNQFHIVEFELDDQQGLPSLRGTIDSFVWGYAKGWYRPNKDSGLPARCGFGVQYDHRTLARQVIQHVTSQALEFQPWPRILKAVPTLRYQGPRDLELFETALGVEGWILLREDSTQEILQVARRFGP
jgi:metallophosphoesterase superfamily enzyme